MTVQSPLVGYNTNVRHRGKLYHIQTEDSGIHHPHVITHVFADGGRIIASRKTEYAQHLGAQDLPSIVKRLMQEQHKAMFIELRDCVYDDETQARRLATVAVSGAQTSTQLVSDAVSPGLVARAPTGSSLVERVDPASRVDQGDQVQQVRSARKPSGAFANGAVRAAAPASVSAQAPDASSLQRAPQALSADVLDRAAEARLRASILGRLRLNGDSQRRMPGRYQQTISARPRISSRPAGGHGQASSKSEALRGTSLDEAILRYLSDDTGEGER